MVDLDSLSDGVRHTANNFPHSVRNNTLGK